MPARVGRDGVPVLLEAQDRRRWDQLLIRRGLAALARAEALGKPVGPYVLQAEIAACHARPASAVDTDWARIARLYDLLAETAPSPVVEVNSAVAHGRAHGPAAGLAILIAAGIGLARSLTGRTRLVAAASAMLGAGQIVAGVWPPDPAFGYPAGAPAGYPEHVSLASVLHGIGFSTSVLSWILLLVTLAVWLRRTGAPGVGNRHLRRRLLGAAVSRPFLEPPSAPWSFT